MSEIAITLMLVPIIIGFGVYAVIGAGNPTVDAGLDKMQTDYPVLYTNSSLPNYCLTFIVDFWCFDPADIPGWVQLLPGYMNVTLTRIDGFQEVTGEITTPQNFTVFGETVNVSDVNYIWGFLTLIFAVGAVLQFAELVRGN